MIILEPFRIEHFDRMHIKPQTWASKRDRQMIEAYGASGPSLSLMDDDLVICCGGICCAAWKGFGEVWLVPSIYVDAYPKSVYAHTRKFIADAIDNLDLYRVQATIKEHDKTSIRWIEKLGFVREGLMMKFGPNQENQFMYARVK